MGYNLVYMGYNICGLQYNLCGISGKEHSLGWVHVASIHYALSNLGLGGYMYSKHPLCSQ